MTSVAPEESVYHNDNVIMHHLKSIIASSSDQRSPVVMVSALLDSHILSTERRHELADQVTKAFARSWLPSYKVIYVEQIEAFIAIDPNDLIAY